MIRRSTILSMVVLAGVVSCGGSSTSSGIASSLLEVRDLAGPWSVNPGPEDMQFPESGVITDAEREFLPRMDLCDEASQESKDVLEGVEWEAFRQFDLEVDDPVDVPGDREGQIVFAQEFLMSGTSEELTTIVDNVAAGLDACQGEIPAGEEGPGTLTRIDLAPVGDESVAALYTIEEAGGSGMWYVYVVFARRGTTLVSVTVANIVLGDLEPLIGVSDVVEIATLAVDKTA